MNDQGGECAGSGETFLTRGPRAARRDRSLPLGCRPLRSRL